MIVKSKHFEIKLFSYLLFAVVIFRNQQIKAQQFNSDSYISKPLGMATIIVTVGERYNIYMSTFSLIKNFEFTTAAYVYNDDKNPLTDDGYSTTLYLKYMFIENQAKTGGWSVKFGTGLFPGLLDDQHRLVNAFKTYWMNSPLTLSLFENKISWDLMPGASYRVEHGVDAPAWAFTYSTRVAWYAFSPKLAIVGEVFGAEGQAPAIPEYKIGLRLEPNATSNLALTYGQEFNGTEGARLEFGIMLFTPPFFSVGGLHRKQKKVEP